MNGYKTGGNWTDVTSIGRNEVVFEGRHKAYGAYYIRKRYSNSLLFAFFSAISLIAVCAFIPYLLSNREQPKVIPDNGVVITPVGPITVPTKPTHSGIPHPPVQPPKQTQNEHAQPVVTEHNMPDTSKKDKMDNTSLIASTSTVTGTGEVVVNPDPGPPGGGTMGGGSSIPKRDTFVLGAQVMPKFSKGNLENYLVNQINYPAEESQRGVQGTVYASFIIEKDGSVSNVTLKKGLVNGPNINREALRVLSEMPKWSPALQDGHPVRIQFTIPINFTLR